LIVKNKNYNQILPVLIKGKQLGVNAKGFYLLLYSKALRTLSPVV